MPASSSPAGTVLGHMLPAAARPHGLLRRLRLAMIVRAQRRSLAELDDATLRDIGITRSEALAEARRRAWDVPSAWLR